MKETNIGIAFLALLASFGIKVTSTVVESDSELEAVNQNIERFAEAASSALFCEQQLGGSGHSNSAGSVRESYERLRLATRIIPERKTESRKSNIKYFDDHVARHGAAGNQQSIVNAEFGGCADRFVGEISAYSQEAEHTAREWKENKEHTLFMYLVYKVIR